MGEARRKNAGGDLGTTKRAELQKLFEQHGINYSAPGFYDEPSFLRQEQRDARFLENYALWVRARERSAEYDNRVRTIVPQLANIISARLDRHEWYGGCIAITAMLSRMLERLGIWNAIVKGSASLELNGQFRHFAIIDANEGAGTETGHMWLICPPYDIVDLTLHHQRWQTSDRAFQAVAPKIVLAETTDIVKPKAEDHIAPALRNGDPSQHIKTQPDLKRISTIFPTRQLILGGAKIRYAPGGITAPDGPLETCNLQARQGVPAMNIWNEDVLPTLGL